MPNATVDDEAVYGYANDHLMRDQLTACKGLKYLNIWCTGKDGQVILILPIQHSKLFIKSCDCSITNSNMSLVAMPARHLLHPLLPLLPILLVDSSNQSYFDPGRADSTTLFSLPLPSSSSLSSLHLSLPSSPLPLSSFLLPCLSSIFLYHPPSSSSLFPSSFLCLPSSLPLHSRLTRLS